MRIPQKLEYACRVLVQMAASPSELRRVDELAQAEDVSSSYLLQILNDLRHAGLVESRRGKNGGYLLAQEPGDITLKDIVVAIEGTVLAWAGPQEGASGALVARAWKDVAGDFEKRLEAWTLERMSENESAETWMI